LAVQLYTQKPINEERMDKILEQASQVQGEATVEFFKILRRSTSDSKALSSKWSAAFLETFSHDSTYAGAQLIRHLDAFQLEPADLAEVIQRICSWKDQSHQKVHWQSAQYHLKKH